MLLPPLPTSGPNRGGEMIYVCQDGRFSYVPQCPVTQRLEQTVTKHDIPLTISLLRHCQPFIVLLLKVYCIVIHFLIDEK